MLLSVPSPQRLGAWLSRSPAHSPQLKEVVLKSSKVVRADVCVVGIGEWVGRWVRMSRALGQSLPFSSLSLSFHICKMGTLIVPTSKGCRGTGILGLA